jgi:hypothetical protein
MRLISICAAAAAAQQEAAAADGKPSKKLDYDCCRKPVSKRNIKAFLDECVCKSI